MSCMWTCHTYSQSRLSMHPQIWTAEAGKALSPIVHTPNATLQRGLVRLGSYPQTDVLAFLEQPFGTGQVVTPQRCNLEALLLSQLQRLQQAAYGLESGSGYM